MLRVVVAGDGRGHVPSQALVEHARRPHLPEDQLVPLRLPRRPLPRRPRVQFNRHLEFWLQNWGKSWHNLNTMYIGQYVDLDMPQNFKHDFEQVLGQEKYLLIASLNTSTAATLGSCERNQSSLCWTHCLGLNVRTASTLRWMNNIENSTPWKIWEVLLMPLGSLRKT